MDDYEGVYFIRDDGSFDTETCPARNTKILLRHGLVQDNSKQILEGDILILPSQYLCPISYSSGVNQKTKDTVSIHWFNASWQSKEARLQHKKNLRKNKRANFVHSIVHIPNRILLGILGKERYENLKKKVK